jgi:SAM-dependent methyltransferase
MNFVKIKKRLPWSLKIIFKLILSRLSFLHYGFWKQLGLFEHGRMNEPAYAEEIFRNHYALCGQPVNFTCMEMGNGDSLITAINAHLAGAAKTYLIDVGFFANTDVSIYKNYINYINNKGTRVDLAFDNYSEMLNQCHALYLTNGIKSMASVPDNSVDIIFSQAVLEHVYREEFIPTVHEMYRILKHGGKASHVIDLKDHLEYSLHNLRFSSKQWESPLFHHSGFYTNRLRKNEILTIFRKAGFVTSITDEVCWDTIPVKKRKLAEPFRSMDENELLTSSFTLLLSKEV